MAKKESEIRTRYKEGELSLKVKADARARGSICALRERAMQFNCAIHPSTFLLSLFPALPLFLSKKDPMILIPVIKSFSRRGRARVRLCYSRHE